MSKVWAILYKKQVAKIIEELIENMTFLRAYLKVVFFCKNLLLA